MKTVIVILLSLLIMGYTQPAAEKTRRRRKRDRSNYLFCALIDKVIGHIQFLLDVQAIPEETRHSPILIHGISLHVPIATNRLSPSSFPTIRSTMKATL